MQLKLFEVRDRGTFIPVMAVRFTVEAGPDHYLLRRAGFGNRSTYVMLINLNTCDGQSDPYSWTQSYARTLGAAHVEIEQNWERYDTGTVIDVEYILGETPQPKISERIPESTLA